jgi:hypothetical protein
VARTKSFALTLPQLWITANQAVSCKSRQREEAMKRTQEIFLCRYPFALFSAGPWLRRVTPFTVACAVVVCAEFVSGEVNAQQPPVAPVTIDRANLRTRAEFGAPVIKTLAPGARVELLGAPSDETGFVQGRLANGTTGWVFSGLLRTPSASAGLGCGTDCGTQRWSVKTGVDADAGAIEADMTETTVDELRALDAPQHKPADHRVVPNEERRFRVEAWLIGWRREGNDSDYHIVISDLSKKTHTMIIESVDPHCQMACSSTLNAQFKTVRQQLAALGTPVATYKPFPQAKHVVVTGVGFFDFLHGQIGVAPNGIELHPILDIQFND